MVLHPTKWEGLGERHIVLSILPFFQYFLNVYQEPGNSLKMLREMMVPNTPYSFVIPLSLSGPFSGYMELGKDIPPSLLSVSLPQLVS